MSDMMINYLRLSAAALLPVLAAALLYVLEKKTKLGRMNYRLRQMVIGVVFGGLAVFGTEYGIPMGGAQINCRDAAVLTAGLLFGAPAGILAGLIGGIERWISVAWGVGTFTRLACTVSTVLAGFYSAALRKFMFEDKKPGWLLATVIGVVMEILHMTMIFITNMATPEEAMLVVKNATGYMVSANAVSVMLSTIAVTLLSGEQMLVSRSRMQISQTIQRWLLLAVMMAFAATSFFVVSLQNRIAISQTKTLLQLAMNDIAADVVDTSDQNMLTLAHQVDAETEYRSLMDIARQKDLAEINMINRDGVIVWSNESNYIGYDMHSGEQSAEFLCLLEDAEEYVQNYGPISYDKNVQRKYAGVKTEYGFLQIGYDARNFQKDISKQIIGITKNRHVGKTGFILILDEAYDILSVPEGLEESELQRELIGFDAMPEESVFRKVVNGETSFCSYQSKEGYDILAVLPESEALQMRNISLYVNTFMEVLVFAVLFGLIYLLIKRVVVDRIKDVNRSLARITDGDLGVVVNVRSNEEFASLSDDINSTVDTLKRYIDEAAARIDKELEFAKEIQSSALPGIFPKRRDFEIFASMDPAKEVGGDFYDFYIAPDGKLNVLIADVSGKGIPAAMFMMRAKTELKSLTETGLSLDEVFSTGNHALCEGNDAGMFVTAWQGGLDLTTGKMQFANAGHNPPLVRRSNGKFEYLKARAGFVLAGMDSVNYRLQELQLQSGDMLFLYTDGATEATNSENQLYGEERLQAALNARDFSSVQELCEYVRKDIDAFVGDAPQFDDLTMMALKFIGVPPVPSIHFDAATLEDTLRVKEFMEQELEKRNAPMKTIIQLSIAIDELFSNIVHYGYPHGAGPITVELIEKEDPHSVSLRFTDEGVPYNPLTKEDPDITLSAEERDIGGLGIYMVKQTMDDMRYIYENDKNILTITKKL